MKNDFFSICIVVVLYVIFCYAHNPVFAQPHLGKAQTIPKYSVKLIPYPTKDRAEKALLDLKSKGYNPYLKERLIEGNVRVFVITISDFKDLKQAEKFLNEFVQKTGNFAYITKFDTLNIIKTSTMPLAQKNIRTSTQGQTKETTLSKKNAKTPTLSSSTPPPLNGTIDQKIAELEKRLNKLQQEAEARKRLEVSEEEKKKKQEKILEAAGREYLLLPKGRLGLEYALGYSYYSYDTLESISEVEHHANHSLVNTLTIEYPVLNNLTLTGNVPFVYKYDKVKTKYQRTVTDIGDISFGVKYQPFKNTGKWPAPIFSSTLTLPTGRGIYDIDVNKELSTGGSLVSLTNSVSVSKPIDPVNVFASLGYTYSFEKDGINQVRGGDILEKVKPDGSLSGSVGLGYALSYNMSLSLSYSYSYSFNTKYYYKSGLVSNSGTSVSSSLGISTGWYLTPKRSIIFGLGIGLTENDPDFSVSLRIPLEYNLQK